jgi:predicted phosphohydrolase
MKFKCWSDLHIEGWPFNYVPVPEDKETILFLAGDIGTLSGGLEAFLIEQCDNFKYVIYVFGNHEFYNVTDMDYFRESIQELKSTLTNLITLENDKVYIDGVRILGTPLWTNFQDDYLVESQSQGLIRDFDLITIKDGNCVKDGVVYDNYIKLRPNDYRLWNQQSVKWLRHELDKNYYGKTIIITHWSPTKKYIQPKFKGQFLNPYFNNDLDFLFGYYNIDTWIFGHTHQILDTIHYENEDRQSRIISNARGYNSEYIEFDPNKIWEV